MIPDPKCGKGCVALMGGVAALWAGLLLLNAVMGYFGWSIPRPVGSLILLLVMLGVARFILNQIFD